MRQALVTGGNGFVALRSAWPRSLRELERGSAPGERVSRPAVCPGGSRSGRRSPSQPMGDWIKDPLRERIQDLPSAERLRNPGLIAPEPIQELLPMHLAGRDDAQAPLWQVLVLQAWLDEQRAQPA